MTTIAYHHESKTIAVDSRATSGQGIIGSDSVIKYHETKKGIFVMCGVVADISDFIDGYPEQASLYYDCCGYLIKDGKAYLVEQTQEGIYMTEKLEYNSALGSGSNWALASMDHGRLAKDAVKYAMTRDIYSGGKIRIIKVK